MDDTGLFKEAYEAYSSQDTTKTLSLLNEILTKSPKNEDALFFKATVLVKDDHYFKALKVLEELEGVNSNHSSLSFLKAYCFSSLNMLDKAQEEVDKLSDKSEAIRNLEAQIAFKKENYDKCLDIYTSLLGELDESHPDYNEILTNYEAAVSSCILMGKEVQHKGKTDSSSHDYLFNLACSYIARGDFSSAQTFLEKSLDLCRRNLTKENWSADEIEQESTSILAQIAYVQQLQGDASCINTYEKIIKTTSNKVISTIADNNLLAIRDMDDNAFAFLHKIRCLKIYNHKSFEKLTSFQKSLFYRNEMALLLALKQYSLSSLKAKASDRISSSLKLSQLIDSISFQLSGKTSEATRKLKANLSKDPHNLASNFALAQLYIQSERFDLALKQLEDFWDNSDHSIKVLPGLVGTLVWLNEQTGNFSGVETLLEKVIAIESFSKEDFETILKRKKAFFQLNKQPDEAVSAFLELLESQPDDQESLSGLIHAYSTIDPVAAEQYRDALPKFKGLEASDIEASFLANLNHVSSNLSGTVPAKRKTKSKCRRKNKPPKNLNPFSKPDPQRWLPMRDRTYFKSKSNKQRRGNQGAATPVIDIKEEKTPEVSTQIQSQPKPKNNKSKKKKAGNRF